VGAELFSYINTLFCSNKLAWLLAAAGRMSRNALQNPLSVLFEVILEFDQSCATEPNKFQQQL